MDSSSLDENKQKRAQQQSSSLLEAVRTGTTVSDLMEVDEIECKRAKTEDEPEAEDADIIENQYENIVVHKIETDTVNCNHEVALPPDVEFTPLRESGRDPAKYYPFQLDAFQKQAIMCIENNQSVLVSAHSSSGKTSIATYIIAQCLRDKQRVIYTSPIKALSNQKFRELEEEFTDVGMMTGDVTHKINAACLVMTTDVLRSTFHRGSDEGVMKEVGWVVYDDIHYRGDKDYVWEETIILMNAKIKHAYLSENIPNAIQFARWVSCIKQQPCNVVYTENRPTPLQKFILPIGAEGLYEVLNDKGDFCEDKFRDAMSCLSTAGDKAGSVQKRNQKGTKGDSNVLSIIRTLRKNDMMPCIIFSLSWKECEAYAHSLKELDFNTGDEKEEIIDVFDSATSSLTEDDQKLAQFKIICPLLRRGIGVYHENLLPILNETIEILFGEGLLKVLFTTETFSIRFNMPARTVILTSARKIDGTVNRFISPREFIQMSGRAGRRGKDDSGTVILMIDNQLTAEDAKNIIKGAPEPLNSQFRLTYNTMLNFSRLESLKPIHLIAKTFYQFQTVEKIQQIQKKILECKARLNGMLEDDTKRQLLLELYDSRDELKKKNSERSLQVNELKKREKVLRSLFHYLNVGITAKGSVVCSLSASKELVLAEMLAENAFNNLDEGQIAAVISCFVFKEHCPAPKLTEHLSGCLKTLKEKAIKVAMVHNKCGLKVMEEEYENALNPALMNVVFEWVNGAQFSKLLEMTDISEGAIVRCFSDMFVLLGMMSNASKHVGKENLNEKFQKVQCRLMRSVYVPTTSIAINCQNFYLPSTE